MCEYEIHVKKHNIVGPLCTLTVRHCLIEDELKKSQCQRRLWANQYKPKEKFHHVKLIPGDPIVGMFDLDPER